MKKFIAILAAALMLASCAFQPPKLTLMQGKPEIDAALKAYADAWGKKNGVAVTIKTLGGSNNAMGPQLKADYAAGNLPDIFTIQGLQDYKDWSGAVLDLSDQPWVGQTNVAFKVDGKVYGAPVSIEGWGLAYNADLLAKAGIDPATLNNLNAYTKAFEKLDKMKKDLGITSVVSMAASVDMGWVTGDHNFNSYLSNGLAYDDQSVATDLLAGKVNDGRLADYADWVGLLFKYADKTVLTTGNYDAQVNAFATGKAVFLHQGNWVDPNLKAANATFKMGFAPHGSMKTPTDGIFVAAPSFYVVNKDSKNVKAAEKFLADLVATPEGQKFMVVDAGMIPAYSNVTLSPSGPLSASVQSWAKAGKIYAWDQYLTTGDFRSKSLVPIYNQFATGAIDKAKFIALFKKAVADLKQ